MLLRLAGLLTSLLLLIGPAPGPTDFDLTFQLQGHITATRSALDQPAAGGGLKPPSQPPQ